MDPMEWFSLYKTYDPDFYKRDKPRAVVKHRIAKNILITLALGAGGALITMNPAGAVYFMVHGAVLLALKELDFKREIKRLEKKGYVALTKRPEGFAVKLLKKAKCRLKQLAIKELVLPKNGKWDGKWRLFIFDVPEKNRLARDMLRQKLKDLGMLNIQRSVFAYPYDCRKELDFVADHFGISRYATFAEVSYMDIDKELRRHFKI